MSKEKNSGPSADFFESPAKTGWLTKLGGTGLKANWRRRYVVLDHHYLFYYKTDKDRSPAGIICLPEYDIVAKADYKECKKQNSFVITSSCNIVATTQSDQKRPYYMFTDTEQECQEWITAVETEMIATIDLNQKPFFTVSDIGSHSTVKNGYQDVIVGNLDDITRSEDGPRLEHITANRPKKPHTRAPSRGGKDFVAFDEDDISSFSFSPLSDIEESRKVEKRPIPKKPSHSIKPMKPPSDILGPLLERPIITRPKPPVKPTFLKSSSQTEPVPSPVKTETQTSTPVEQTGTETGTVEFIPKPTPRRKAPTVPEAIRESRIIPPVLPTHPRALTEAPFPSDPILPPTQPDSPPARRHAPSVPSHLLEEHSVPSHLLEEHSVPSHLLEEHSVPSHLLEEHSVPSHLLEEHSHPSHLLEEHSHPSHLLEEHSVPSHLLEEHSVPSHLLEEHSVPSHLLEEHYPPSHLLEEHSPPSHLLEEHSPFVPSHSREEHYPPSAIKHSPSQPETSFDQPTPIRPSPSLPENVFTRRTASPVSEKRSDTSSPIPDTIVSPLEDATYKEPYFTKLSTGIRDSSSSDSPDSENVYQIPRIDPIYQIPSGLPVLFTERSETDIPFKIPLQKLRSVGHSVTPSPKPSTEGPNYTDLVTGYYCSSSNTLTSPVAPLPAHTRVFRNHLRSQSLPRQYNIQSELSSARKSSSSPDSSEPNNDLMLDTESTDRMLYQIRELEEQLLSLTSSPKRHSLSPYVSQSNSVSHVLQTDALKLIDNLRSVVFEAISFHKQASESLQSARTEKRIAEKERKDAQQNSENLSNIIAKFQQST